MMIFHKGKQFLFNNLWHGEQLRLSAEHPAIYTLVTPDPNLVWGVDISHWNLPPVDLVRMRDQFNLSFVIIKGSDGTLRSRHFDAHRQAAKDAGLPWGIYDWLYPNANVSIEAQTTAWANQYNEDPPPLGVFIDAEWTKYAGNPANPSANDLRSAHDKLKAKINKTSHTYTAKGYADTYLIGFDWSREPLWVANYGVTSPNLPKGATAWHFWQFSSTLDGHLLDPNGNAELDGNYYNGTYEQFLDEYGGDPIPHPPGDDMLYEATLNQGLNIRNGVGTSGTSVLLTAQAGDKIIASRSTSHSWFVIDHCIISGEKWVPPVQAYCSSWEGYYSSIVEYVPPLPEQDEIVIEGDISLVLLNGKQIYP